MLNRFKAHEFPSKNYFFFFCLLAFSLLSFKSTAHEQQQKAPVKFEYATFYMETEGEFVVPVGADAPAIYTWSEPGRNIKGNIPQIWHYLGIKTEVEYSFTDIESIILNHVADMGWELQDLAITSAPIYLGSGNFRTAYRYVFKRKNNSL